MKYERSDTILKLVISLCFRLSEWKITPHHAEQLEITLFSGINITITGQFTVR